MARPRAVLRKTQISPLMKAFNRQLVRACRGNKTIFNTITQQKQ